MNMHWIDWLIVGALIAVTVLTGTFTKRYVRGVADYLSANRCAGRYLMTVAQGIAGLSVASMIANYEQYYKAGFPALWWQQILLPTTLFISLSGFVRYRFRETRALTMAQFFEMRYSRKFRVFSGLLCWFSGILNYGIFPGVTARLLISFCGLPDEFRLPGLTLQTFPVVMLVMLSIALYLTLAGGQIALLVTDFIQGQFALIVMIGMTVFLLLRFDWSFIMEAMRTAPENQSLLNPYRQSDLRDFSIYFFLMTGFLRFYGFMAWQGSQGYYSSAESPHEAKMSGILSAWRSIITPLVMIIPPVIAFTVLHHGAFAEEAAAIQSALESVGDLRAQGQVRTPVSIVRFLPVGAVGLFAALAVSAAVSTDDTYLHSWGSIFVQDVLLPFKKKKLTALQHIRWLRLAAVGTAVVAFFFSLFFPLREYIFMYFSLTAAVFMGGAGSVIIGGLYWKRGTTAGAWASMIAGCVFALVGIVILTWWKDIPWLVAWRPKSPVNGMQWSFITALLCIACYWIVSLLTCRQPFNMDWLLHRGSYAVASDRAEVKTKPSLFWKILGVDKEYALSDKLIAAGVAGYTLLWCVLLAVGTVLNRVFSFSDEAWGRFWQIFVISLTCMGVVTVVWFVWGGISDSRRMFRKLSCSDRDLGDDGTVTRSEDDDRK